MARNDHTGMKLVAWLIGMLMLLQGAKEVISLFGSLRYLMAHGYHIPHAELVLDLLRFVLCIAGIIAGIGLVRLAPWARRMAVWVTLGSVGFFLVSPYLSNLACESMGPGLFFEPIPWYVGLKYFMVLRSLLAFVFLVSWPMRKEFGEGERPTILTEIAERVYRVFPAAIPPVAVYLAIYFFCLAGDDFLPRILRHTNWYTLHNPMGWSMVVSVLLYAIIGALLLVKYSWGRPAGIVFMGISAISLLAGNIYSIILLASPHQSKTIFDVVFFIIFVVLPASAGPLAILWALLQSAPPAQPPTESPVVATS